MADLQRLLGGPATEQAAWQDVPQSQIAQFLLGTRYQASRWWAPVSEPFRQSQHVYRAIGVCLETLLALPARVIAGRGSDPLRATDDDTGEVTSGAAYDLLHQPSYDTNLDDLLEELAGNLLEGGECHVIINPDEAASAGERRPRSLAAAGRREMRAQTRGRTLLYWAWMPEGEREQRLVPGQQAYVRLWNPYERWRGLSPAEAFLLGLSADYLAQQHTASTLKNDATPAGAFVFPGNLNEEERGEFRRKIEQLHGGVNKGRFAVLEGGVTWQALGQTLTDLGLIDLRKLTRQEAYAAFGVPVVMGGIAEEAHYNTADAAQEIFLYGRIGFLGRKLCGLLNRWVLPRVQAGVRLVLDLEQHYVLQRVARDKIAQFVQLVSNGAPRDAAAKYLGLPLDRLPHGEKAFAPATWTTLDEIVAGPAPLTDQPDSQQRERPEDEEQETPPQEQQEKQEDKKAGIELAAAGAAAQRYERRLIQQAAPRLARRLRAHFVRQEREIIRRVKKYTGKSAGATPSLIPQSPNPLIPASETADARETVARVLLNLVDEQRRIKGLLREWFPGATRAAVVAELKRLGVNEDEVEALADRLTNVKGPRLARLLRLKEARLANVERVTRRRVQATLLEGLKRDETVQDLATRVHQVLGGNRSRAVTIATTEAGQATSVGRFAAMQAAGVAAKAWLTGANPRASHLVAGRQYAVRGGAIPFDEPFTVGQERLMYPRDPAGSAAEIINCNCTQVAVARPAQQRDKGTR